MHPARVFLSHTFDAREAARHMKVALEGHGLEAYYSRVDLPFGSDIWATVKKEIRDCDHFLVLLSPGAANSEGMARELSLARRLNRQRRGRPLIIGVTIGNSQAAPKALRPRDVDTGKASRVMHSFARARAFDSQLDEIGDLADQLSVKVTAIADPEGPLQDLFESSLKRYVRMFPREERDPPDAIRQWLAVNQFAEQRGVHWRDLWAVMHTSGTVLGFAFFTAHIRRHWCFANYFAIEPCWRQDARAVSFLAMCRRRLLEMDPECRGILFEVDPIAARAPRVSDRALARQLARNGPLGIEIRSAKRLLLYSRCRSKMLQVRGRPMPYWQPPLDPPLRRDRNVPLHLLAQLFHAGDETDANVAISALDFIYRDFYPDAYGGADEMEIPGYRYWSAELGDRVRRPMARSQSCGFAPFTVPKSWRRLIRRAHRMSGGDLVL